MDTAIIVAIIACFQAISVAIIVGLFAREAKKRQKAHDHNEQRAKIRARESLLSMNMQSASIGLAIVTGCAVRDGKTNGKMETALEEAEKAQQEYYKFINSIAAERMSSI